MERREPLWNDVVHVTDKMLTRPSERHHPHFLGAVVLQQVQRQTGQMQERTIIDGQQRLLLHCQHSDESTSRGLMLPSFITICGTSRLTLIVRGEALRLSGSDRVSFPGTS
jgi:hypothetical protein